MKPKVFTDIVEDLSFERVQDADGKSSLKVKGIAKRADFINKNRRYYPEAVLSAAVKDIQDDVQKGALLGLIRHPDMWQGEGSKGHVQMTAIKWTDIRMEGKDVHVEGLIVDTAAGKDLKALVDAKVHIGLSTNMKGAGKHVKAKDVDATYQPSDEYVMVFDQLGFQTIDVVNSPADVNASLTMDSFEEDLKTMDLETLKKDNPELYKQLMDEARAEAQGGAAAAQDEAKAKIEALEASEAQLKDEITQLKRAQAVSQAITDAKVPGLGTRDGIDLDARFQKRLTDAALAADSDEKAIEVVQDLVTELKALVGAGGDPSQDDQPDGNNPGIARRADEKKKQDQPTVRSVRASYGLS